MFEKTDNRSSIHELLHFSGSGRLITVFNGLSLPPWCICLSVPRYKGLCTENHKRQQMLSTVVVNSASWNNSKSKNRTWDFRYCHFLNKDKKDTAAATIQRYATLRIRQQIWFTNSLYLIKATQWTYCRTTPASPFPQPANNTQTARSHAQQSPRALSDLKHCTRRYIMHQSHHCQSSGTLH